MTDSAGWAYPASRGDRIRLAGLAAVLCLSIAPAGAAPHVPASDDEVLAQVPAVAATRSLAPLQRELAAHPDRLNVALALARGYIDIGRSEADPRFVSYAQVTLAPWVARAHAPVDALILQATALQYLHRFDDAQSLLRRALAAAPLNPQAALTLAAILQVQGRFQAARAACRPLLRASGSLVALTCLTGIDSLTGHLQSSYRALRSVGRDDPHLPPELRVWIANTLADMADRSGDLPAAEGDLRAALRAAPNDPFSRAAYADLLLRTGRAAQVLELLAGTEQQDNLLLRLAIAARRLNAPQAPELGRLYSQRMQAARRDGDLTHAREAARFALEVRGDPRQALELALLDWQVQREPADVRVLHDCISATHDTRAAQVLTDWIRTTGYEDRYVTPSTVRPRVASR